MQREEADYLLAVAKRFGWETGINEVVRNIVMAEMMALQKSNFYAKRLPGDD